MYVDQLVANSYSNSELPVRYINGLRLFTVFNKNVTHSSVTLYAFLSVTSQASFKYI